MGGTLGVWLGPRSGNSDISSWVKTEQNWSPMMLTLLRLSVFLQRGNTSAVLLAGFDEIPKALWVLVVVCQHVICILVMCLPAGLLGLSLDSLVSQPVIGISWLV